MLKTQSVLADTALQTVLGSQSYIDPKQGRIKRTVTGALLLTALIDAFSVLVIFLLMSFSSTGEILFVKDMELPKASITDELERNLVVKVEGTSMFLESEEVTSDTLIGALIKMRKSFAEIRPDEEYPGILTVQADRRVKYEILNQIVVAASAAGFGDIRFAVLMK